MNAQCGNFIQVNFNRVMEDPDPGNLVDEHFAVYGDPADDIGGVDRGLLPAAVRGDRCQPSAGRAFATVVVLRFDRYNIMMIQ